MPQDDRKMWKQWAVTTAYESQEGLCLKCGANLEQTTFHQHHKDGDHSNNALINLQLLCPKCHHATYGEANSYTEHKAQEARILDKINVLIEQALDPNTKISGASMEKLVDAMSLSLKVSRNVTDIDYGREYTPSSIKVQRRMSEQSMLMDKYMEGYMDAVKHTMKKFTVAEE